MTQNERLVTRIKTLVGIAHYDEVTQIIDSLLEIEHFKQELNNTNDAESKFQKIAKLLHEQFHIENLKIIQIIDGFHKVSFEKFSNDQLELDYFFEVTLSKKGTIRAELYNDHLNEFDKIRLDSYLDEILKTLYLTVVLEALQESALIDPLTGLKNRVAFNEEMKEIIPLALREHMNIGVLLFNIDRFRAVNDEHGTQFGDKFLQNYAEVLKDNIRSSDIAIRFGGGEFLILLINVSSEEKTLEIAKGIQKKLNDASIETVYGDNFLKTVSVGISMFPEDTKDIFEAVHFASTALSDAKDTGRSMILRYPIVEDGDLDLF